MKSIYIELALFGTKNEFARTDNAQLFQARATVCHFLTSFKVKIQLDHYCIDNYQLVTKPDVYVKGTGKKHLKKTIALAMEATLMFISFIGPNLGYSQNTRDEQG